MKLPKIYLHVEPSPDLLVQLEYPEYCLRIRQFNQELQSYNAEQDFWIERVVKSGTSTAELSRLNSLIPKRFIALRQSLKRRYVVLKRRDSQQNWIDAMRSELLDVTYVGGWRSLFSQSKRDARRQLQFLDDPTNLQLKKRLEKRYPDFVARCQAATLAIPPFLLSPIDFHAPSIHPLSRKLFASLKAHKRD